MTNRVIHCSNISQSNSFVKHASLPQAVRSIGSQWQLQFYTLQKRMFTILYSVISPTILILWKNTRGDPEIRGKRSPFLRRLTNRAEN